MHQVIWGYTVASLAVAVVVAYVVYLYGMGEEKRHGSPNGSWISAGFDGDFDLSGSRTVWDSEPFSKP